MRAQVLTAAGRSLASAELPAPRPGPQQLLIAVRACAVCRTDLHVVDGELPDSKLPLVLGHEIIGTVVSGVIHMSDIPSFPYRILWEERVLRSVANLTRRDAEEFLALAPKAGIRTETVTYSLAAANQALSDLRNSALQGAAVLIP